MMRVGGSLHNDTLMDLFQNAFQSHRGVKEGPVFEFSLRVNEEIAHATLDLDWHLDGSASSSRLHGTHLD